MTGAPPAADPNRVIASLARDQVNLDRKTVDLCFLAGLYPRADKAALASFEEDVLIDLFEQVCDVVDPGATTIDPRTHLPSVLGPDVELGDERSIPSQVADAVTWLEEMLGDRSRTASEWIRFTPAEPMDRATHRMAMRDPRRRRDSGCSPNLRGRTAPLRSARTTKDALAVALFSGELRVTVDEVVR